MTFRQNVFIKLIQGSAKFSQRLINLQWVGIGNDQSSTDSISSFEKPTTLGQESVSEILG